MVGGIAPLWRPQAASGPATGDRADRAARRAAATRRMAGRAQGRSEEHTSELQSLMRISYAVFCLKKKKTIYSKNNQRYCVQHDNTTAHKHLIVADKTK